MPFTATLQALIKTDDGCTTSGSLQVSSLTAQSRFDEIIPAGILDLSPYLANMPVQIQGVIVIATNGTFTVSLDGSNYSTRKFSQFYATVGDSGALPLKINITAQCRIQFMAVGL